METVGLILDLGKVLVDFDHLTTCRRLAADASLAPEAIYQELFGSGLAAAFETGRLDEAAFAAAALEALRARSGGRCRVAPEALLEAWGRIFSREEENLALLAPLASAFALLLLSNTNATHYREVLRLAPEVGRIPHRMLSFEVGLAKPDPAIYRAALARIGLPAGACIFVDDRPENLAPATAMGIRALLHQPGTRLANTLARAGLAAA